MIITYWHLMQPDQFNTKGRIEKILRRHLATILLYKTTSLQFLILHLYKHTLTDTHRYTR